MSVLDKPLSVLIEGILKVSPVRMPYFYVIMFTNFSLFAVSFLLSFQAWLIIAIPVVLINLIMLRLAYSLKASYNEDNLKDQLTLGTVIIVCNGVFCLSLLVSSNEFEAPAQGVLYFTILLSTFVWIFFLIVALTRISKKEITTYNFTQLSSCSSTFSCASSSFLASQIWFDIPSVEHFHIGSAVFFLLWIYSSILLMKRWTKILKDWILLNEKPKSFLVWTMKATVQLSLWISEKTIGLIVTCLLLGIVTITSFGIFQSRSNQIKEHLTKIKVAAIDCSITSGNESNFLTDLGLPRGLIVGGPNKSIVQARIGNYSKDTLVQVKFDFYGINGNDTILRKAGEISSMMPQSESYWNETLEFAPIYEIESCSIEIKSFRKSFGGGDTTETEPQNSPLDKYLPKTSDSEEKDEAIRQALDSRDLIDVNATQEEIDRFNNL